MKMNRKVLGMLMMLFLASGFLQAQEDYQVSTRKEIKIVKGDSIVLAEVSRIANIEIELNPFKRYYWYHKGEIQSNLGGIHGNLLDGKFELFKSERLILKGSFEKGLKTGIWKAWNQDGGYVETYQWKDGYLNGEAISYFASGTQKEVFNYKEGQKHGSYQIFNENTKLKEEGKYKKGEKHGRVNLYTEGEERKVEKYKHGELQLPKPKKEKVKKEKSEKVKKEKKDKVKEPKEENKEESKLQQKWKQWFPKKEDQVMEEKDEKKRFQGIKKIFQKKAEKE